MLSSLYKGNLSHCKGYEKSLKKGLLKLCHFFESIQIKFHLLLLVEFILLIEYGYHGSSSPFQLVIQLHLRLIIQIFDGFLVHTIDGLLIVFHCAWLVWAYFYELSLIVGVH